MQLIVHVEECTNDLAGEIIVRICRSSIWIHLLTVIISKRRFVTELLQLGANLRESVVNLCDLWPNSTQAQCAEQEPR